MKKLLILLILTFPSLSVLSESKDWNKNNVVELCGGMSSVSPFIGDRGEILSIKVNEEEKTATFSVLSGKMIVTSTCYLKPDGRTSIKTDSILPK